MNFKIVCAIFQRFNKIKNPLNLALKIARRYLFSKKSTNAINIITGISVFGISVGTAALVLVLSVFNGFEDLISGLFSNFNPDVKVTPQKGKSFSPDPAKVSQILALEGVEFISKTLEEVAFFEYKERQDFGILKGVDTFYNKVTSIDSTVFEGEYKFKDGNRNLLVLGGGMRNKLSVNTGDPFELMKVFMAKRKKVGVMESQFNKRLAYPIGTFKIQQDFDNQYVLASLNFVQGLLGYDEDISALEIKLNPSIDEEKTIAQIRQIMGSVFSIKNRYQQDEAFLRLMNIEKWMSFAILSLTLILVAFNMIGSLWMVVLEKKKDIAILKSMGAADKTIRNIFLHEGLLLCLVGMGLGFIVAIVFYLLQKTYGIVPIPEGFVVNAYPISIRFADFIAVTLVVVAIGAFASIPPAMKAKSVPALIREE